MRSVEIGRSQRPPRFVRGFFVSILKEPFLLSLFLYTNVVKLFVSTKFFYIYFVAEKLFISMYLNFYFISPIYSPYILLKSFFTLFIYLFSYLSIISIYIFLFSFSFYIDTLKLYIY